MFSEAYDAAPPLPRPLKTKHTLNYINADGLLLESLSVAPLNEAEEETLREKKLDKVGGVARRGVRCSPRLPRHHQLTPIIVLAYITRRGPSRVTTT
jgi:hypothetical protein